MDERTCPTCDQPRQRTICRHCGTALARATTPDEERALIEAYHHAIAAAPDDATRARMLRHGPVPDRGAPLVDASVRVVAMLDACAAYSDLAESTLERANTLLVRMRVMAEVDADSRHAKGELERAIGRYTGEQAKFDRSMVRGIGVGCLMLLVGIAAFFFLRR